MGAVSINNASLEYVESGRGDPLVLVHGSASDYRTWQNQQDEFAKHFRTITYSRRYHWPNKKIPAGADYTMAEHVTDLESMIEKLEATPAHLLGHSYGAFLCLLLAIKRPEYVRTLVLAEPPVITLFVSNTPKPLELLKLFITRPSTAIAIMQLGIKGLEPAKKAAKKDNLKEASRYMGQAILGEKFYSNLSKSRREQVHANTTKAELLGSGFEPLADKKLRNLKMPTLLIHGSQSPDVFHKLLDRVEELIPQTERVQIANASHIMHEDNAPSFNSNVLDFLKGHSE